MLNWFFLLIPVMGSDYSELCYVHIWINTSLNRAQGSDGWIKGIGAGPESYGTSWACYIKFTSNFDQLRSSCNVSARCVLSQSKGLLLGRCLLYSDVVLLVVLRTGQQRIQTDRIRLASHVATFKTHFEHGKVLTV